MLSEFAGAAAELAEALVVNPYDIERHGAAAIDRGAAHAGRGAAAAHGRAPAPGHRRTTSTAGQRAFLDDLAAAGRRGPARRPRRTRAGGRRSTSPSASARAPGSSLLLDYDGTLVPLARAPAPGAARRRAPRAAPRSRLAPGTRIHVASGRRREDLERWFGALPLGLHAEHGAWSRPAGGEWCVVPLPPPAWKDSVRAFLADVTLATPGSLIEEKTASLAWHYRRVDFELARERLRELGARLADLLRAHDLETICGSKVLEVRVRGLSKSLVVARALARAPEDAAVVAIGDDRTDEDLFAALPPSALTIHVGSGASRAAFRLADPGAVRRFLRSFLS